MTAKSGRRTVFSDPPNERKTASASSLSNILQKKAAVQVRLPIRMVLSVLKLCSVDKCTYKHRQKFQGLCQSDPPETCSHTASGH